MKKIVLIGSTGSIGRQVIGVVKNHPSEFEIIALCAGVRSDALARQAQELGVPVYVNDAQAAAIPEADLIFNAAAGFAGLSYSLAALSKEEQLAERSKWLRRCNYGLRFIDTRALNDNVKNSLYERLCGVGEKWPGIYDDFQNPNRDMFSDFLKLLSAADSCYIGSSPAAKSFPKALCAADPSEVSRTAIITAYYYYYNAVHELDDESEHNTFEKIYDNYCAGLNPILEAAHYQKLSSKNIFDILIVFSSYAMQNIG